MCVTESSHRVIESFVTTDASLSYEKFNLNQCKLHQ
jgi:hypothetical protein